MPRGDGSNDPDKQNHRAEHIEEYEDRWARYEEAERQARATVNKDCGGGKKFGSARGRDTSPRTILKGVAATGADLASDVQRLPDAGRSRIHHRRLRQSVDQDRDGQYRW